MNVNFGAFMYIWMFSVNEKVYYGRTWQQFKMFLEQINQDNDVKKIVFVHNLSFEFQFMRSHFNFVDVMARKSRKLMKCSLEDMNIEFRCTYMMSNCSLAQLPKVYNLDTKKLVGNLDYNKIRTPITELDDKELNYCENDCLVVYKYILRELETYKTVDKIPITSTGHVRRELKEIVMQDYNYRRKVGKAINTNPHVYNLLMEAFMGGYTHANWIYADEVLKNIDSYDFTSSYPYVLVTHMYPSTEFKKCNIKSVEKMSKRFAYLLVVRFTKIKSNYYNNFISQSKCRNIRGGRYDNGRVMYADSLEITLTDIDFYFILQTHDCQYEILEAYYSVYNYLPKQFIEFVLQKYVNKTQYKDVEGMEVEYAKEKNKFNALYGMSVTNMIKDEVLYSNVNGWDERKLSNDEIIKALQDEKKKSFLSFAYGVWVTAYARNNLLKNVIKLDEYVIYCDTDSMKLAEGYDKTVIDEYNNFVKKKIKHVSEVLEIDISKFMPKDKYGNERMLGLFDFERKDYNIHSYEEFITQGAKKYAYIERLKNSKIKDSDNIIEKGEEYSKVLKITVAGVPKSGANALKSLNDFKDDFVFKYEDTGKNLLIYCEEQNEQMITDYQGNEYLVTDRTGCCLLPTTYVLGKALEYANLISDDSSSRAIYKE